MFAKLKKKIEEENQTEINIGIPADSSGPTPTHTRRGTSENSVSGTPISGARTETPDSDKEQRIKKRLLSQDSPTASGETRNARDSSTKGSEPPHNYQELCRRLQQVQKDAEAGLLQAEKKIERLASQAENREELESFQSQEMAKIKHLLLCSQQDVRTMEEKLRLQEEEWRLSREEVARLQTQLQQERQQVPKDLVAEMQAEKDALIQEVDILKKEALQSSNRISQLESTLGNLTDEYDGLKHTHDVYKAKAAVLSEETNSVVAHLTEKVKILEKRLEDHSLTGDEQVQSLIQERRSLETKLDEARQHLSEVKSSWSEKINSLEAQILNLNHKMADDGQECSRLEHALAAAEQKIKEYEEYKWTVEEQLQTKEKQIIALQQTREEELERLQRAHSDQIEELRSQLAATKGDLVQAHKERDRAMRDVDAGKNSLATAQTEFVEREIEMEKRLAGLESDCKRWKAELQKKEGMYQLRTQELECSLQNLTEKVSKLETEKECLSKDLQRHMAEVDQLQEALNQQKAQYMSLSTEKDAVAHQLLEIQEELLAAKAAHSEAEPPVSSTSAEELQKKVLDLEGQVQEKNKAIRLQQQRIADMKKTLQRELKFQQATELSAAQANNQVADRTAAVGSGASGEVPSSQVQRKLENDINFKYLKHVVFKFMTSTEYEAQHLIRAVSVLLHFTADEEHIIRQHLDWKSSWFGMRPHNSLNQPYVPQQRRSQQRHTVAGSKSHSKHGPG
ncbi:golgin subfamily A member 1-like isoform X2 [Ornithodoros turicata]|uniref:golgin subfamily A member 1-like isoform X2 n=1 Tax=Ornithodoros turicata TaxID=34597 RepID=UPI003139B1E0